MKSKFKAFSSILNSLDIFPVPISLLHNNSSKSSTITGKIFTLLIIFYVIFKLTRSDMVRKSNPSTLMQDSFVISRPSQFLNNKNFTLVIGLNDVNSTYVNDSSLFGIDVYIYGKNNFDLVSFSDKTNLKMKPCSPDDFSNPNTFNHLGLQRTFCLEINNFIEIFGNWDEKFFKFLDIDILRCVNNSNISESVICKSKEEIDDFISKSFVQIYISNQNIVVSNYENPVSTYLKGFYYSLSTKSLKTSKLYMKKTTMITDKGLFSEELDI